MRNDIKDLTLKILNIHLKKLLVLTVMSVTMLQANAVENATIEKNAILSINDCIQMALDNSPAVKKARYNYGVSKNQTSIAKADYFPTIGVGTGYYATENATSNSLMRQGRNNYYSAEASLTQLIWDFGKTNANIRMNKFNTIAAVYTFDDTVLDTIFSVKTNYYGVLAAKASVDINKANVQINERNYQRTKAYFEEGIKSKIDLVNAEVNLSDAKVSLVNAVQEYQNALVQLNNSMYIAFAPEYEITSTETFNFSENTPVSLEKIDENVDISQPPPDVSDAFLTSKVEKIDIIDSYKFVPFPYTFEESVELAYKNRPDLKAFDATLEAMKQSLLYIKREYYPSIQGRAGYGYRDTNNTQSFNVSLSFNTSLNIVGKKFEIDNGKLQVKLAENEIENNKQNIYFEVQKAYVDMIQLEKKIPLAAVKVKQTLENFELADGRYGVGLGDYIELQDAKVNYNNAQHEYVQAVYNYNLARANLELAMALPQAVTATLEDEK